MILVSKGKEPRTLVQYRKQKYAYFDGCNKADIRKSLLLNQGYLCAYCMRRISDSNMKIEHWRPESSLSDVGCLEFDNMLGCCMGHQEGDSGEGDTCDAHKGNTEIVIDPRNRTHISQIQYSSVDGTIFSHNEVLNHDINEILNLNSESHFLKMNRKKALDSFLGYVRRKYGEGTWGPETLKKVLEFYENKNAEGKKQEYAGIIIWYIRKRVPF